MGMADFRRLPSPLIPRSIQTFFGGTTRKTFNGAARYKLDADSENFPVELVTQVMYTDRSNFGIANPDPQVGVACTPTGAAGCTDENIKGLPGPLSPDSPGGNTASIRFRSTVIGNRIYLTDVQTIRTVTGFEGTLFKDFAWEVKFNHGQSDGQAHSNNLVDMVNLATFTGDINNLTPADLTLLRVNTTDILKTTENTLTAQISGPAAHLPGGDLTFALGGDIRREFLSDTPDFANATGRTDQGGTPTRGAYDLKEGFLQTQCPCAQGSVSGKGADLERRCPRLALQ